MTTALLPLAASVATSALYVHAHRKKKRAAVDRLFE